MKSLTNSVDAISTNDYLLIIPSPEDLSDKIKYIQKEFSENYNYNFLNLKANITLASFTMLSKIEEKLINKMQLVTKSLAPVKIELSNYAFFPTHTIYINVISKISVQKIVNEIKAAQPIMKAFSINKPHFIEVPYIAIARNLKPWQYQKAVKEFKHRQFTGRFIADHFLLIAKKSQSIKPFEVIKRFDFMNLPITNTQGNLF